MQYVPKEWDVHEAVNTTDLNHMEDGISEAAQAINEIEDGIGNLLTKEQADQTYAPISVIDTATQIRTDVDDLQGRTTSLETFRTQQEANNEAVANTIDEINETITNLNVHRARILKMGINPVGAYGNNASLERVLTVYANDYTYITNDGNIGTVSIPETEIVWQDGLFMIVNIGTGEVTTTTDYNTIMSNANLYAVARMQYIASGRSTFIEGYGNFDDTPATSLNQTSAFLFSAPANIVFADNADGTWTLGAGTYTFIDTTTAVRYRLTLTEQIVQYSFADVLYILDGGTTINVITAAALPVNAHVIGNMNNINGQQTVNIYGLGNLVVTNA